MLRRGRKLPAGNPIPGIGMIEEYTTFNAVVERKVKREGYTKRDKALDEGDDEEDVFDGMGSK